MEIGLGSKKVGNVLPPLPYIGGTGPTHPMTYLHTAQGRVSVSFYKETDRSLCISGQGLQLTLLENGHHNIFPFKAEDYTR